MTPQATPKRRPFWFLACFAILLWTAIVAWDLEGAGTGWFDSQAEQEHSEPDQESQPSGLVAPGQATRKTQNPAEVAQERTDPEAEVEDPNDGWGQVAGTASINGVPLKRGMLHWTAPVNGEQGYETIEQGQFELDVPAGEVQVTAWVVAHGGYSVPNHKSNELDRLTKVETLTILDASLNPVHFGWEYDEVLVEGDALMVPSLRPLAHALLLISGNGPPLRVKTDAAGLFRATIPRSPDMSIGCRLGGVNNTAKVQGPWTSLRVPDSHSVQIVVRDGRTGKEVQDYDLFSRRPSKPGKAQYPWGRSERIPPNTGSPTRFSPDRISLPEGMIEVLVYAPRLGLAPHRRQSLEVGPHTPRLEITLQPGGTLTFTCDDPPPTGLVNPGYDPDPIMVVKERMFDWNEPDVQAFGGHVDREGSIPRNLLFTRRLSFNLSGVAVVKGLPAGTYRVLHWREGVTWRSEPLEVIAGVTTNVHLVPE